MKNQALFSSNDKSKKLKCRLLQFLFCALRVNLVHVRIFQVSVEPHGDGTQFCHQHFNVAHLECQGFSRYSWHHGQHYRYTGSS